MDLCVNCQYFGREFSQCRRYAPRPRYLAEKLKDAEFLEQPENMIVGVSPGDESKVVWPRVGPMDFCGDYKAASGPTEQGMAAMATPGVATPGAA